MADSSARMSSGWWVVGGTFLVVFLGQGAFYSLPIFYPAFVEQFGWSRTEVSAVGAIALLIAGFASPLVGTLVDRKGARLTMLVGTLLVATALALMGLAGRLGHLYVIAVLFGAGLGALSILPVQVLMAKWFTQRRGTATGVAIAGMGLGGTASSLTVAVLLGMFGWREVLWLYAGVLLVIGVPVCLWVVREQPSQTGEKAEGGLVSARAAAPDSSVANTLPGLSFGEAVHTGAFWSLCFSTFCAMFAAIAVIQHLVLYQRGLGYDLTSASRTLSLLLFASVVGRVGLGYLSDRFTHHRTLILSYTLLTAGTVCLLLFKNQSGLAAAAVLTGAGYGGSIVLLTLLATELFGLRAIGKILGVALIFFTAGGSLGPIVVGHLSERFDDYRPAFVAVALAAVAAVVVGFQARVRESSAASAAESTADVDA